MSAQSTPVMIACLLSVFAATFVSGAPQSYGSYGAGINGISGISGLSSYGSLGGYGGGYGGSYGAASYGSGSYGAASIGAIGAIGAGSSYEGNNANSGNNGEYSEGYSHEAEEHYPDTPAHYQFKYEVTDFHTGDAKSHSETREGDTVRGAYSVADPDGHFRIVNYYADPHSGFLAHVSRIPIGHGSAEPIAAAPIAAAPIAPIAPIAHAAPIAAIPSHY